MNSICVTPALDSTALRSVVQSVPTFHRGNHPGMLPAALDHEEAVTEAGDEPRKSMHDAHGKTDAVVVHQCDRKIKLSFNIRQ